MTKLVKNWEELAQVPANFKYRIVVNMDQRWGWIEPIWDGIDEYGDTLCKCNDPYEPYYNHPLVKQARWHWREHHVFLPRNMFSKWYRNRYTKILQRFGFDVEIYE